MTKSGSRVTVQFTVVPLNAAGMALNHERLFVTVGTVADVMPMLDEHTWVIDSVEVLELTGSDCNPRIVDETEWMV